MLFYTGWYSPQHHAKADCISEIDPYWSKDVIWSLSVLKLINNIYLDFLSLYIIAQNIIPNP